MTVSYTTTVENARMSEVSTAAGTGAYIQVWDGAVPASPDATPAGTLLASLACSNPIGGAPSGGVLTFSAISDDTSANASGTPTFARVATTETGATAGVAQMTAGVGSGDLSFDAAIVATGTVSISSLTLSHG